MEVREGGGKVAHTTSLCGFMKKELESNREPMGVMSRVVPSVMETPN